MIHLTGDNGAMIDKITTTIERFSNKVLETERLLRAEMEAKLAEEVAKRELRLADENQKEKAKFEHELHSIKVSRGISSGVSLIPLTGIVDAANGRGASLASRGTCCL